MSDAEADIICVARLAKLESKETAKFRQLVECSVRQWQCGDGALFLDLSDSMLALMENNAQVFFDVMANHDREFNEWLGKLEGMSFTWFQDPPSPLEAKRQRLINILAGTKIAGRKADGLRVRVLTTLKKIKPRQVD
jgi:hypothetical protein